MLDDTLPNILEDLTCSEDMRSIILTKMMAQTLEVWKAEGVGSPHPK